MSKLPIASRLIVAADFDPRSCGGVREVRDRVMMLARDLQGLPVIIKVNSILRAVGYDLIDELREMGLGVFADLKLNDIPETMELDAACLAEYKPALLTVMCSAGVEGMTRVRGVLGNYTEVLGVTVLTSIDEANCQRIYRCTPEVGVSNLSVLAVDAVLAGLILSPKELGVVIERLELGQRIDFTLNTPGIRPSWAVVSGDDQKRVATPRDAILAGADRIVVGRPITGAKPNTNGLPQNPREAAQRTLDEIEQALAERAAAKEG